MSGCSQRFSACLILLYLSLGCTGETTLYIIEPEKMLVWTTHRTVTKDTITPGSNLYFLDGQEDISDTERFKIVKGRGRMLPEIYKRGIIKRANVLRLVLQPSHDSAPDPQESFLQASEVPGQSDGENRGFLSIYRLPGLEFVGLALAVRQTSEETTYPRTFETTKEVTMSSLGLDTSGYVFAFDDNCRTTYIKMDQVQLLSSGDEPLRFQEPVSIEMKDVYKLDSSTGELSRLGPNCRGITIPESQSLIKLLRVPDVPTVFISFDGTSLLEYTVGERTNRVGTTISNLYLHRVLPLSLRTLSGNKFFVCVYESGNPPQLPRRLVEIKVTEDAPTSVILSFEPAEENYHVLSPIPGRIHFNPFDAVTFQRISLTESAYSFAPRFQNVKATLYDCIGNRITNVWATGSSETRFSVESASVAQTLIDKMSDQVYVCRVVENDQGFDTVKRSWYVMFSHVGELRGRQNLYFHEINLCSGKRILILNLPSDRIWTTTRLMASNSIQTELTVNMSLPKSVSEEPSGMQVSLEKIEFFVSAPHTNPDGTCGFVEFKFDKYNGRYLSLKEIVHPNVVFNNTPMPSAVEPPNHLKSSAKSVRFNLAQENSQIWTTASKPDTTPIDVPNLTYRLHLIGSNGEMMPSRYVATLVPDTTTDIGNVYTANSAEANDASRTKFVVTSITYEHSFIDPVYYDAEKGRFVSTGCPYEETGELETPCIHMYMLDTGTSRFVGTLVISGDLHPPPSEPQVYTVDNLRAEPIRKHSDKLRFVLSMSLIPSVYSAVKDEDTRILEQLETNRLMLKIPEGY